MFTIFTGMYIIGDAQSSLISPIQMTLTNLGLILFYIVRVHSSELTMQLTTAT